MPFLTCLAPGGGLCAPLKHADLLLCLRNLLGCLKQLHDERQVVHMDIKPSNIFARYAAVPTSADQAHEDTIAEFLLADFGLALVRSLALNLKLSWTRARRAWTDVDADAHQQQVVGSRLRQPVGTGAFMSLEVAALRNDADCDSDGNEDGDEDDYVEVGPEQDIYSLGRTIDWLLERNPLQYTFLLAFSSRRRVGGEVDR
jgi:serine/threonine protein kinase